MKSKKEKTEYFSVYFILEMQWWLFHMLLKKMESELRKRSAIVQTVYQA